MLWSALTSPGIEPPVAKAILYQKRLEFFSERPVKIQYRAVLPILIDQSAGRKGMDRINGRGNSRSLANAP
jgi:hypothetical protein